MNNQTTQAGQCPNCGYCPHCGRSYQPYIPQYVPYLPSPTPYNPYIVWYGAADQVVDNG